MGNNNIKAILFDSGRVLNEPRTGHWFISPKFFDYVSKDTFSSISEDKINEAFRKSCEYINAQNLIITKEEEYEHFKKFYNIFSNNLPQLELSINDTENLAYDLVYNKNKYKFFDDALTVIPILKSKYKLGIVSDAWPSLKDVYENQNLLSYFDSFVISSILGVTKPDPKMYLKALSHLKIKPEEAVFIDDNLNNCEGAIKLNINAFLLCRDKDEYIKMKELSIGKKYKVINSLNEISLCISSL